jgi:hypothetical protein
MTDEQMEASIINIDTDIYAYLRTIEQLLSSFCLEHSSRRFVFRRINLRAKTPSCDFSQLEAV